MAAVNAMVVVRNNNIESALRLFKKKMKDFGVMKLYEESLTYEKPSKARRQKKLAAIRKAKYEIKQFKLQEKSY